MILYKDIRKNEDSLSNKNENKLIFSKKKIKINIIFKDMINSKKKDNR